MLGHQMSSGEKIFEKAKSNKKKERQKEKEKKFVLAPKSHPEQHKCNPNNVKHEEKIRTWIKRKQNESFLFSVSTFIIA